MRQIVVLTGMRRVGKTTLLKGLFDGVQSRNKAIFDLENPLYQRIFQEKDFRNIWANLSSFGVTPQEKAFLFLDEIQAQPDIVRAIKYLYDHHEVKFILTGSSSFYLKNLFPESLAGRKIVVELFPLDFEEFLVFKQRAHAFARSLEEKDRQKNEVRYETLKGLYGEYLEFGGFPEVVLCERKEYKKTMLEDIFKSYFEKEVRLLADFRNIAAFRDLFLLLLTRVGSKLDISKLASEVGVSRETVYSYFSFLQSTYAINLVSPYAPSKDREVSGAKKVYVCDNGFLTQFARVSEGALLENAVFLNLKKYGESRYYERRSGGEIDFILPASRIALEVKEYGHAQDYHALRVRGRALKMKECYVVTKYFTDQPGFIPALEL